MVAKLLHILILVTAILGSSLAHNAVSAATDELETQHQGTYYKPEHSTNATQVSPPAPKSSLSSPSSSEAESPTSSTQKRDTYMGNYEDIYSGGLRPTATKTPAPWIIPEHTKIPVAVSESAASAGAACATGGSDPGFVLLGAAVGVIILGMGLV